MKVCDVLASDHEPKKSQHECSDLYASTRVCDMLTRKKGLKTNYLNNTGKHRGHHNVTRRDCELRKCSKFLRDFLLTTDHRATGKNKGNWKLANGAFKNTRED